MRSFALLLAGPLVLCGCTTARGHAPLPAANPSDGVVASAPAAEMPSAAAPFREDALSIIPMIDSQYAYLDRFGSSGAPNSERLRQEAERVSDRASLVRYAERALLALADHHAITGSSLADSWAVIPSFADLWIVESDGAYTIDAVRDGSPAQQAGIARGDRLVSVGSVPIRAAVTAFWADLGLPETAERAAFAARVLAAGRRDRPRQLDIERNGTVRSIDLPSLYAISSVERPPLTVEDSRVGVTIRFNNSLGNSATIAAFDAVMAETRDGQPITIDLRDTPSGGNTSVARAVLGWFVDRPRGYQVHQLPAELRETGIARQWIEQVLPRAGRHHAGPVRVLVGRWTGSMGEGLAIGFDAIGAKVAGSKMAGLLGAVYDHPLDHSGLVIKIPTERLMHVDGTPREKFVPRTRAPG